MVTVVDIECDSEISRFVPGDVAMEETHSPEKIDEEIASLSLVYAVVDIVADGSYASS